LRAVVLVFAVFSELALGLGLACPRSTESRETTEVAERPVLDGKVATQTGHRVAGVVGAFIAVVTYAIVTDGLRAEAGQTGPPEKALVLANRSVGRGHAALAGGSIADVGRAFIAVVFANDTTAKVAAAVHADAGRTTKRAGGAVADRVVLTRGAAAAVVRTTVGGARVVVAAVHVIARIVGGKPVAACNERNHQENEDPKELAQVSHSRPRDRGEAHHYRG